MKGRTSSDFKVGMRVLDVNTYVHREGTVAAVSQPNIDRYDSFYVLVEFDGWRHKREWTRPEYLYVIPASRLAG